LSFPAKTTSAYYSLCTPSTNSPASTSQPWLLHLRSATYSGDGKLLATNSGANSVKVWDAEIGQETLTLKGSSGGVAFSPDGRCLASGGADNTVKIYDATPVPEKP